MEFVYAFEHEEALVQLESARQQVNTLVAVVRQLAWTKPHKDQWELSFLALQEACQALAAVSGSAADIEAEFSTTAARSVSRPS